YFIQNTVYWLKEYRFDGLRFDAVHEISEEDFLFDLARIARGQVESGRHIALVLENERNNVSLIGGPPQFDAQWTDDFHHVMHVLLTKESEGYYNAFQDATNQLRRILAEGFAYQGESMPGETRGRGSASGGLPSTAFVIFLQNHDQIGNRALGERLSQLSHRQAVRAATALMLLSPFVPMLFMGEEWASKSPFLFFTDHHDELADLVREGRRNEFRHFAAFADEKTRDRIPDPNAPSTFAASVPEQTDPSQFEWMRSVLSLRQKLITPGIPGCRTGGADVLGQGAVRASWTLGNGRQLTVALNLGDESVDPELPEGQIIHSEGDASPSKLGQNGFIAQLAP
ncbi:MAG: DUF3459 domain-containing protein, partial [Pseudomonadota bacterium]|nr:DUF3459 domain-containing protein [Pseudomonadota bacterium]